MSFLSFSRSPVTEPLFQLIATPSARLQIPGWKPRFSKILGGEVCQLLPRKKPNEGAPLDQPNRFQHSISCEFTEGTKRRTVFQRVEESTPLVVSIPKLHASRGISETCIRKLEALDVIRNEIFNHHAEDSFYVADMFKLAEQDAKWHRLLPRVSPFYAVKCCPDPNLLSSLAMMGAGFDCASRDEMERVLALGVPPSRIVYANPCKQESHIRYAVEHGVLRMTFDNPDEMKKIMHVCSHAELILRILPDDSHSVCKLGTKFGASFDSSQKILREAQEIGAKVVGVSFHVGSGCFDASAFGDAVLMARHVFDYAESLGMHLELLDVGGGFPGNRDAEVTFEEIADVLRPALDEHFPNVQIIAEPGRFYAASVFTLATRISSRREVEKEGEKGFMLYINDGVYGSFNCTIFDHVVIPRPMPLSAQAIAPEEYPTSVWGPTCDSMDCISQQFRLPELHIGDWLVFETMGAYTWAAYSNFNGFERGRILYINQHLARSATCLSPRRHSANTC